MNPHTYLTQNTRYQISALTKAGLSQKAIAIIQA